MPLYTSATTVAALGVSPKWLDNLLSHNKIDGVQSARQGVARRLSLSAVHLVAIAHELVSSLDVSVSTALDLAQRLMQEPSRRVELSTAVSLSVDVESLQLDVRERLARAVDVVPHRRRGRHPGRPARDR